MQPCTPLPFELTRPRFARNLLLSKQINVRSIHSAQRARPPAQRMEASGGVWVPTPLQGSHGSRRWMSRGVRPSILHCSAEQSTRRGTSSYCHCAHQVERKWKAVHLYETDSNGRPPNSVPPPAGFYLVNARASGWNGLEWSHLVSDSRRDPQRCWGFGEMLNARGIIFL